MTAFARENQSGFEDFRRQMVEEQLRARGIEDVRILEQMGRIPREHYVPASLIQEAYRDSPVPIGYGQTLSQPYVVAYMTELLEVHPLERILEIGTGSGYQTAVLAGLAREVYSVEIFPELYEEAQRRLAELGYKNIFFLKGDGWRGWPEKSPFDKVIVTAAPDRIPDALVRQLREGGRLVIPVGRTHDTQQLLIGVKRRGVLETMDTISVRFVPLIEPKENPPKAENQ